MVFSKRQQSRPTVVKCSRNQLELPLVEIQDDGYGNADTLFSTGDFVYCHVATASRDVTIGFCYIGA
jgi:hypothetical protein